MDAASCPRIGGGGNAQTGYSHKVVQSLKVTASYDSSDTEAQRRLTTHTMQCCKLYSRGGINDNSATSRDKLTQNILSHFRTNDDNDM